MNFNFDSKTKFLFPEIHIFYFIYLFIMSYLPRITPFCVEDHIKCVMCVFVCVGRNEFVVEADE